MTSAVPNQVPEARASRRTISAAQMASVSVGSGSVTLWLGLLGLVTTPIMIHHLGATLYGVFALITIMSAYLLNLEFGFGTATVRYVARAYAAGDRQEQGRVLGTSLAVFLITGCAGSTLAFVAAPWIVHTFFHGRPGLRSEATDAIRLGAVILAFTFLSVFAGAGLQAIARFRVVVITRGVFGTLTSASAVTAVLVGGDLRLVLAALSVVAAAQCVVLFVFLARCIGIWTWPRIHMGTFRMMAAYGAFIVVSGVAFQILLQGPPTVLAHLAPTAAVAAFAVANLIMQQLVGVATSTSIGFMPFAAAAIDLDRSHLAAVYRSNLRVTLLFIGPVAIYLAVFAHTLLGAWIDPTFAAGAAPALQWLSLAALMLALSSAPADVVRGAGHPRWIALFTGAAATSAVALSFALVGDHGAGGAGLALAAALVITTLPFIVLVGQRLLQLRPVVMLDAFARPLAALILVAGVYVGGSLISKSFAGAVVTGAVGASMYALGAYHLVLLSAERTVLLRAWRAFRSRHISAEGS